MKNRKLGFGSISLLFVFMAFIWAYEIYGICTGDLILSALNIPTWSDNINQTGTHYTVFYTYIILVPALVLAIKYSNNLFAKVGKWLSILFLILLVFTLFFMVV